MYLIISAAIGAEILLRMFDPIGIEYTFEIHRYFRTHEPDERFAYVNRPNLTGSFQGVTISINGHGFRRPELSAASADNPSEKRIMILGDSVVFGWGVRFQDTFSPRLQRLLDREDIPAKVIPIGVCSWNTRTEYEFLRAKGLEYKPDILVLVITQNDAEIKREGRTGIPRQESTNDKKEKSVIQNVVEDVWRYAIRNSYLIATIQYVSNVDFTNGAKLGMSEEPPGWKDAEMALGGIIDFARDHGIELVIYLYQSELAESPPPPLDLYDEYLAAQDISTLSLPDALFTDKRHRNSLVDSHPNSLGHELIAQQMLEDLKLRLHLGSQRSQRKVHVTLTTP